MTEAIKCPECVKEGKTSRLYSEQGGATTDMAWECYYDEKGRYHMHNPNSKSWFYKCSNGHSVCVSKLSGCKSCGTGDQIEIT